MGIEITREKLVVLRDDHQQLVRTDPEQPAGHFRLSLGGHQSAIPITYLFPRVGEKRHGASSALAAALKQANGYTADRKDILSVARRAMTIGARDMKALEIDTIVPMPSSALVVPRICTFLQRRLPNRPTVVPALRKRTYGETVTALAGLGGLANWQKPAFDRLMRRLEEMPSAAAVEIKGIPIWLRPGIPTIALSDEIDQILGPRILIVDDLVAAGTSFPAGCHRPAAMDPLI